jgi:hypothetical protein
MVSPSVFVQFDRELSARLAAAYNPFVTPFFELLNALRDSADRDLRDERLRAECHARRLIEDHVTMLVSMGVTVAVLDGGKRRYKVSDLHSFRRWFASVTLDAESRTDAIKMVQTLAESQHDTLVEEALAGRDCRPMVETLRVFSQELRRLGFLILSNAFGQFVGHVEEGIMQEWFISELWCNRQPGRELLYDISPSGLQEVWDKAFCALDRVASNRRAASIWREMIERLHQCALESVEELGSSSVHSAAPRLLSVAQWALSEIERRMT